MSRPGLNLLVVAKWAAVPLGLVIAVAVTVQANRSDGTISLSRDDSNTAMFNATGLKPGASAAKCTVVTSTGTLATNIRLFGTNETATHGLDGHINVVVEQGSGSASGGHCTRFVADGGLRNTFIGTLASFAATHRDFRTGFGTFAADGKGAQSKIYRITYTVDPHASNRVQGSTVSMGLTWESQRR